MADLSQMKIQEVLRRKLSVRVAEKGGVDPETEASKVPLLNKSLAKCVSISFLLQLWDRMTLSIR